MRMTNQKEYPISFSIVWMSSFEKYSRTSQTSFCLLFIPLFSDCQSPSGFFFLLLSSMRNFLSVTVWFKFQITQYSKCLLVALSGLLCAYSICCYSIRLGLRRYLYIKQYYISSLHPSLLPLLLIRINKKLRHIFHATLFAPHFYLSSIFRLFLFTWMPSVVLLQ